LPGGKREFRTYNTVTVTKIILQDIKVIDNKANEFDVNKVKYDDKFWNEYFPIERR
jgi:polyhydroxyalkanoate synthesis regulator protein